MFSQISFNILGAFSSMMMFETSQKDKKTINNDKTTNLEDMFATVHKNTNAQLILIVCDVIFCMRAKHIIASNRFFEGAKTYFFDSQIVLSKK